MAGETTVTAMNGIFKTVYANELVNAVPDFAVLQKKIPFTSADKETGNFYAQPVALTGEQGFTSLGTSGDVAALNAAVTAISKEAQVYGSELNLRSQLSYKALSQASAKGNKAFKKASAWKVENMNDSMRRRIESLILYGQVGLGTVASVTSASGSGTITLTDASWAAGLWAGAEGTRLDSFTSTTKDNGSGDIIVTSVDSDTKTLSVTCTGTFSGECAAGDVLYYKGGYTGSAYTEMAGLQKIITNSGELFGINASTYSLWKGNSASSFGEMSFEALQNAIAKAVNKGLMEKVIVLLSPKAFAKLNSDAAGARVYDSKYTPTKGENGFQSLTFHSTNGLCEVLVHPMVKDGDCFILPLDSVLRLGSSDVTFGVPGMDEQFFSLVPGYNAVELQCYADQAIFIEKPAHAVYCSGITYS